MKPLINLKGRPSPFFYLFFLPSACSIPFGIVPRFSRRPFCTGRHRKLDRARSRHRDSRPPARAAPIKVASPTACLGGFASLRHSSLRGPAASRPPLSARLIGREFGRAVLAACSGKGAGINFHQIPQIRRARQPGLICLQARRCIPLLSSVPIGVKCLRRQTLVPSSGICEEANMRAYFNRVMLCKYFEMFFFFKHVDNWEAKELPLARRRPKNSERSGARPKAPFPFGGARAPSGSWG